MKTVLTLLGLALVAFFLHLLAIAAMITLHIGPFWSGVKLIATGATSRMSDAAIYDFFRAAERATKLDHYVLWPLTFLVTSLLAARLLRPTRLWHSLVIATAVLPMLLPPERIPVPGYSIWSAWRDIAVEYLVFAGLVAAVSMIASRALFRRSEENAVA